MSRDIDVKDQKCPSCNGSGSTDIVEPNRKEIDSASHALFEAFHSDKPAGYALAKSLIKRGWHAPN